MRVLKYLMPLCVACTMMFAGSAFVAKNAPLYADANGGASLGNSLLRLRSKHCQPVAILPKLNL